MKHSAKIQKKPAKIQGEKRLVVNQTEQNEKLPKFLKYKKKESLQKNLKILRKG